MQESEVDSWARDCWPHQRQTLHGSQEGLGPRTGVDQQRTSPLRHRRFPCLARSRLPPKKDSHSRQTGT